MRLYGSYDVTVEPGETYRWEPDDVTPGEEIMILTEAGYESYEQWVGKVDRREANATQTLVWYLRRKAGREQDRAGVVIAHRKVAIVEVEAADVSPEAPADSDSETSESATSSPS